jgi:hypothetical protein
MVRPNVQPTLFPSTKEKALISEVVTGKVDVSTSSTQVLGITLKIRIA